MPLPPDVEKILKEPFGTLLLDKDVTKKKLLVI
jgi:hypothetical protein